MSTADLLGEIKQLRADLALTEKGHESALRTITNLGVEIEPLKALLREAAIHLRASEWEEGDNVHHLLNRIRDALGEGEQSMTDSEKLTAAGYRRRPGRKAIGEDE